MKAEGDGVEWRRTREELGLLRDREGLVGLCDLVEAMDGSGKIPRRRWLALKSMEEESGDGVVIWRRWRLGCAGIPRKILEWQRQGGTNLLGFRVGRDKPPMF